MTKRPWMPLYIADFHADTTHLNAAETGAYLLLIMHYWRRGKLPIDEGQLARIARLSRRDWGRYRATLKAFFQARWKHKRIDKELAQVAEISTKRSASASKMHERRAAKAKAKSAKADTLHTSHSTSTEPKGSAADAANPRARLFSEGKTALVALGVTEKRTGALIGRWLKDTGDNESGVLEAIQRARDNSVADPIAWITASLKPRGPNGQHKSPLDSALDDLVTRASEREREVAGEAVFWDNERNPSR